MEASALTYAAVLIIGLLAGGISGIIGTGSSILLLPILVFQYGPQRAVPIMAIAALMSNVGKILAWWREVNWPAFAAFSVPGVPAAALGARTLLVLPAREVDVALGLFFLIMIPARRQLQPVWIVSHRVEYRFAGSLQRPCPGWSIAGLYFIHVMERWSLLSS